MKKLSLVLTVGFTLLNSFLAMSQSITDTKIEVLLQENRLKAEIGDQQSDSIIIENLNQIALYKSAEDLSGALSTLQEAEALAVINGFTDLIAVTHYNRGQVYEQHGDFAASEASYLRWFNIRKQQDNRKYRWAMTGMREFYSRHLQLDKLDEIDAQWVNLLDNQVAHGEDVLYGYEASMHAVIDNLVALGEIYKAESYFLHLLEHEPDIIKRQQKHMFYFSIERYLIGANDIEGLKDWYTRWFNALDKYADETTKTSTIKTITLFLTAEVKIAGRLMEHIYQLAAKTSKSAEIYVLSYWLNILNQTATYERNKRTGSAMVNQYIQHCIVFNIRAAVGPASAGEASVREKFLEDALLAAESLHSKTGVDLNELNSFLKTKYDAATDKKAKKTIKKVMKTIKKL